jgi:hypothetical protein
MSDLVGKHFTAWTVLSTDATGKRAACRCVCSRVQVIAVDALTGGSTTSCGCQELSADQSLALRAEAEQRRRQRDRDWRPSRGRS